MADNQQMLVRDLGEAIVTAQDELQRSSGQRPDIRVGVVSTDLGSRNGLLQGCPELGDDGQMNPLRYGPATVARESREPVLPSRPEDCGPLSEMPRYLHFGGDGVSIDQVRHDLSCHALLYTRGCGVEQPLEAVYRALVWSHDGSSDITRSRVGDFLRRDAMLLIVVLSDEEDGSVRDCRYREPIVAGMPATCNDSTEVFNAESTAWSSRDSNLRYYTYSPCGAQDPTWPLDRYVAPLDLQRGFLGLKPGHPERVVFAAITGVPVRSPRGAADAGAHVDWSALLGASSPLSADDFCARRTDTSVAGLQDGDAVSMRHGMVDDSCPSRVVPACYRVGTPSAMSGAACNATQRYFAWPSQRIVEVARRFDESVLCNGVPCRNGFVSSICENSFRPALLEAFARVRAHMQRSP